MKHLSKNQPTLSDILNTQQAIYTTVVETQKHVTELQHSYDDILETIHDYAKDNETRFQSLENGLAHCVTNNYFKSYIDDKLADLRGDILGVMKEQDEKTLHGFEILHHKKIISRVAFGSIANMKPFPKKLTP